jgi:hypothetical protein
MAIYLYSGSILLDSGAIATSEDCCCGGGEPVCDLNDGDDLFVEFCKVDGVIAPPNNWSHFFDTVYDLSPVNNPGTPTATLSISDVTLSLVVRIVNYYGVGLPLDYAADVDFTNLTVGLDGLEFYIDGDATWEDPFAQTRFYAGRFLRTAGCPSTCFSPTGCRNIWTLPGVSDFDGTYIHGAGATLNGSAQTSLALPTSDRWGITYANASGDLDCTPL